MWNQTWIKIQKSHESPKVSGLSDECPLCPVREFWWGADCWHIRVVLCSIRVVLIDLLVLLEIKIWIFSNNLTLSS